MCNILIFNIAKVAEFCTLETNKPIAVACLQGAVTTSTLAGASARAEDILAQINGGQADDFLSKLDWNKSEYIFV